MKNWLILRAEYHQLPSLPQINCTLCLRSAYVIRETFSEVVKIKRPSLVMRQKMLIFVAEFATLFAGNRRILNIKCPVFTRKGKLDWVQMGCDITYSDIGRGQQKAMTSLR